MKLTRSVFLADSVTPTRFRPVLARFDPLPNELFRSLLARTAKASSTGYREFIQQLGFSSKGATPSWVGIDWPDEQAEIIGALLRHSPETLQLMRIPFHRGKPSQEPAHPTRYRACAECQVEHGGWMRWNADPFYVVCPIHKTLLWNERPDGKQLKGDSIFSADQEDVWGPYVTEPNELTRSLARIQSHFGQCRFFAYCNFEVRFTEMVVSYRRALNAEPKNPAIAKVASEGWEILEACGRERSDREQQGRITTGESIWTRVEDAIAIYPVAVPEILRTRAYESTVEYDEMSESLKQIGEKKRIQTNSAARFAWAVFVEDHLDSEEARQTRRDYEAAIREREARLLANPKGAPRLDDPYETLLDRFPFSPLLDPEARMRRTEEQFGPF